MSKMDKLQCVVLKGIQTKWAYQKLCGTMMINQITVVLGYSIYRKKTVGRTGGGVAQYVKGRPESNKLNFQTVTEIYLARKYLYKKEKLKGYPATAGINGR